MIRFTSLTRANITHEQHAEVGNRAMLMGVDVATIWFKREGYVASVRPRGQVLGGIKRNGSSVYAAITAALDAYEAEQWTADEILTVAAQSGLDVTRA